MKIVNILLVTFFSTTMLISNTALSAVVDFNTLTSGSTSFSVDGDGDFIDDVIFSTTDPSGFNTAGPGSNQSFISEPGLEGTTLLSPDLRVDFLNGAVTSLSFGFAVSGFTGGVDSVGFSVFDSNDMLLDSILVLADFTLPNGVNPSTFPEGLVDLSFLGLASYALFDFSANEATRFIIDDFSGTFGSTENISAVPLPAAFWLFGSGLIGLFGFMKGRKSSAIPA